MHQKFIFINNHSSLLVMSLQPISNILSSIVARFKHLQNKTGSNLNIQSPSNNQPDYSGHCVNISKSEAVESPTAGDWWARLYRGLVIDSSAKHYRQMKQAYGCICTFCSMLTGKPAGFTAVFRQFRQILELIFLPFAVGCACCKDTVTSMLVITEDSG